MAASGTMCFVACDTCRVMTQFSPGFTVGSVCWAMAVKHGIWMLSEEENGVASGPTRVMPRGIWNCDVNLVLWGL